MSKQPISKQQIIAINTVISKKGLTDEKKKIISDASNGRTASSKELFFDEAQALLMFLNSEKTNKEEKTDKQVRKLVALSYDLGWIGEKPVVKAGGKIENVKDYSRLYDWVLKYGYLKKDLKEYKEKELPALITQLQKVAGYYLKK